MEKYTNMIVAIEDAIDRTIQRKNFIINQYVSIVMNQ